VAAWRRSGLGSGEFAASSGLAERSLKWWAWRLGGDGVAGRGRSRAPSAVSLVPLRLTDEDRARPLEDGESSRGVRWSLHTERGELRAYGRETEQVLVAAVAGLLGAKP